MKKAEIEIKMKFQILKNKKEKYKFEELVLFNTLEYSIYGLTCPFQIRRRGQTRWVSKRLSLSEYQYNFLGSFFSFLFLPL